MAATIFTPAITATAPADTPNRAAAGLRGVDLALAEGYVR